jgi:hypothetical protein
MRFGQWWMLVGAGLALATTALGQTSVGPVTKVMPAVEAHVPVVTTSPKPTMSTEPATLAGSCSPADSTCKQVQALSFRLSSVENQLKALQAKSAFVCKTPSVSANGAGLTDNCTPSKSDSYVRHHHGFKNPRSRLCWATVSVHSQLNSIFVKWVRSSMHI